MDINNTNYRSISPRARSYGVGAYDADTMFNMTAFRGSNGRADSYGYFWSNSGSISASTLAQVSALDSRPSVFWNARTWEYASAGSAGTFTNQNNDHFYSIWRLTDSSNIVADAAGGNRGTILMLNHSTTLDDQLFAVNGQGKGDTANGSPLAKVVVPANYTDFSATHPLLMSLTGGLSRGGGDVVSKTEPNDAYWRAGNHDYYLNYYSKYDGTSKKLLAKDDGMDWSGLLSRTQIDGSQPLASLTANAVSFAAGYSKVCEIAYI